MFERERKRERLSVSVSTAVLIEDDEGRLLFVQQADESKGFAWGPPAGGLESHEDPIMCAKREVREEIGIEVEITSLVGIYTADRGDSASGLAFVFKGRIKEGEFRLAKGEIMDCRFFTSKEIRELATKGELYKPEYNLSSLRDWESGCSFPIEAIRSVKLS